MSCSNSNINNGLITKIWGPPTWVFFHSVTFGYPINPTDDKKKEYMNFFENFGNVLPCKYCRDSYKQFISSGCTKLTADVFVNRDSLTRWGYYVHNSVNRKLGVDYGMTYNDIVDKYESFRAVCSKDKVNPDGTVVKVKGCIVPADKKAESYKVAELQECPIICLDLAEYFTDYANLRDVDTTILTEIKHDIDNYVENKKSDKFAERNIYCRNLIKDMRIKGTPSVETDGEWKNLPTVDELQLIVRLSSNLTNEELVKMIQILPSYKKNYKKVYKLSN